uniref:ATP-dependent helicase Rep n=1 Tax=Antarctic circular DNA molecule TaxID=2664238 RepID=A0A5Q2EYV3_9ZZZZ|nr:replication associated protein [Antarctic circular DNA molecule]
MKTSSQKSTQKCSGNTNLAKRTRNWALTFWDKPEYDEKQMSYFISGTEVCPNTQKIHYQSYVHFTNAKTFDQVKKYFINSNVHIECAKGTANENIAYCSKDNDYLEYGEKPCQGKRTDLIELRDQIQAGRSAIEIGWENPNVYHQYGRTLNFLEDFVRTTKFRTEMTTGTWLYGPTGVGKSHQAFEGFTNETHYCVPKDGGWWDGYNQQETVIFNDFRGHIPYDEMLTLCDKFPTHVRRRGRAPMPFTSSHIIVTSSLSPAEVYHNRDETDDIAQLLRRFKVIKIKKLESCFKKDVAYFT